MSRSTSQHRRSSGSGFFLKVAVALVLVLVLGVAYVVVQLLRTVPVAAATVSHPTELSVGGRPGAMPWPSIGAAAVRVEGIGSLGGVNQQRVMPLASVTKLVAALTLLRDHPLRPGQAGPQIPITRADVTAYHADVAQQDSVLKVAAGEQLTEHQALEGMLIPSGDNVADIVASWDAHSKTAFVTEMNAEAKRIGLTRTHLGDASGLSAASAGTAADMITLAGAVLANPVLRAIVAMPQVTLPVAGTVYNYNYDLGHDGIFGIKTGSTGPAGGNLVFAAHQRAAGRRITIIGAVLGQQGRTPLPNALAVARRLVLAAPGRVATRTILPAGVPLVRVTAPWGQRVVGHTATAISALSVPGQSYSVHVVVAPVLQQGNLRSLHPGQRLATVIVHVGGRTVEDPVVAGGRLSPPSLSYRLGRL